MIRVVIIGNGNEYESDLDSFSFIFPKHFALISMIVAILRRLDYKHFTSALLIFDWLVGVLLLKYNFSQIHSSPNRINLSSKHIDK